MWMIGKDDSDSLTHYGVKGMKKGVRKDRNKPATFFGKPNTSGFNTKDTEVKPIETKPITVNPANVKGIQLTKEQQAKKVMRKKTPKEIQDEIRRRKAYHRGVGMPTKEFSEWKKKRRSIYPHLD